MVVHYDIEKISNALQDFYNAIGTRIDLLKDDFSIISTSLEQHISYCRAIQQTVDGKKACKCSDIHLLEKCKKSKKPVSHICHAGLVDIAMPILYEDTIIGYIILGEMKTSTPFSDLKNYILNLGLDEKEMEDYYQSIAFFDSDKIQSVSNIATMLVKHIFFENMLEFNSNDCIHLATKFINNNLDKNLSIKNISKSINVSKSVLYKRFHEKFNCTVSEYIKKQRIEKSVELLANDSLSIEEISQRIGFSSASYYSKVFKKQRGVSPLKFKKTLHS